MTVEEVRQAAQDYLYRGWAPIPVEPRSKRPNGGNDWNKRRLTADELLRWFSKEANVGVLLGELSGGLVDVDLDDAWALAAADAILPPTSAVFGRASKPRSHRLYIADPIPANTSKFEAPKDLAKDGQKLTIVELRANGQTVFPPSEHESGERIQWYGEPKPEPVDGDFLLARVSRLAAAALLARAWPSQGSRDDCARDLCGALAHAGWEVDDINDFVRAVVMAANDEEVAMRLKGEQAKKKLEAGEKVTGWPSLSERLGSEVVKKIKTWLGIADRGADRIGDIGNGELFAERHGESVIWVPTWKKWAVWEGSHWERDHRETVHSLAQETVHHMHREALKIIDEEIKKKAVAHAVKSATTQKVKAMMEEARTQVAVPASRFDTDPMLLNCLNGTLDLRTGELRPHQRTDYLTKVCPVEYDDKVKSDLWEGFLDWATDGDAELGEYLQIAAGYSITGDTSEEVLFFVYGPGQAGKSTFVTAIKEMMGDHAATAEFSTFLARAREGGIRNDLASLIGTRLVSSIEVEDGKRLAEAMVKEITGGDKVKARHLYEEFQEFKPSFKIWLVANHRPSLRNDDGAIWRRIRVLPFDHPVPDGQRDDSVKKRLITPSISGAAVLAWAVKGCLLWQEKGLKILPQRVINATQDYRGAMDFNADFWEDRLMFEDKDGWESSAGIQLNYNKWADDMNVPKEFRLNKNRMALGLKERGCREFKKHNVRGWLGVKINQAATPGTARSREPETSGGNVMEEERF